MTVGDFLGSYNRINLWVSLIDRNVQQMYYDNFDYKANCQSLIVHIFMNSKNVYFVVFKLCFFYKFVTSMTYLSGSVSVNNNRNNC